MAESKDEGREDQSHFNRAFRWIIQSEGSYVNHPLDKGGPTKFGITLKTLQAWRGKEVSYKDVQQLSLDEAKQIYKIKYWMPNKFDRIKNKILAVALFDMAVNMGPKQAIRLLQEMIGTTQDGVIGPKTIASLEARDPKEVLRLFADNCRHFYADLAHKNPQFKAFIHGWFNRCDRLLTILDV